MCPPPTFTQSRLREGPQGGDEETTMESQSKRGFSALKVREVREHLQEDMSLNQALKQVLLSEVQRGTLQRHRHVEGGSEKNQWWG